MKYQGTAYACSSLCVVNVGGSEAKIEVVLNSFLQLEHLNDTLQTETMLEGGSGSPVSIVFDVSIQGIWMGTMWKVEMMEETRLCVSADLALLRFESSGIPWRR